MIVAVRLAQTHFKGKENDILVHSHVCNCILMLPISTYKHEIDVLIVCFLQMSQNAKARFVSNCNNGTSTCTSFESK